MIDLRVPVNLPPQGKSYAVRGDTRFPTFMYHVDHPEGKIFKTEQAFNDAGDGWVDSPAKVGDVPVQSPVVTPPVVQPDPVAEVSQPSPIMLPDATLINEAADIVTNTVVTEAPREFTAEELKSVHKAQAGELIDGIENSATARDMVQFIHDVEQVNPKGPRPSVIAAAQARLAKTE